MAKKKKQSLSNLITKHKTDKTKDGKVQARDFVAKNMQGQHKGGAHQDKTGQQAGRTRQKRQWKKEMNEKSMIQHANADYVFESADPFGQAITEIEQEFNISLKEKYDSENDQTNGFNSQQKRDMNKLIQQYQGQAGDVHDQLGNDLEMLEYQPDEIPPMISYITSQLVSNN